MTDGRPLFDRLNAEPDPIDLRGRVYDLAAVRAAADRVIDLDAPGRILAVSIRDGLHVSFVVFDFHSGPSTASDGKVVDGIKLALVFHGNGPSGNLRELRHTWWGEDGAGYLFSPNSKLIAAAFGALREWFDC